MNHFFFFTWKPSCSLDANLNQSNKCYNQASIFWSTIFKEVSPFIHVYTKVVANSISYFHLLSTSRGELSIRWRFLWCNWMGYSIPSLCIFRTFGLLFCCLKGLHLLLLPCFFLSLLLQLKKMKNEIVSYLGLEVLPNYFTNSSIWVFNKSLP